MPDRELEAQAEARTRQVVTAAVDEEKQLLTVDSPPGAGKTRLTREVIQRAMDRQVRTLVAVQTNSQAIDLVRGMAQLLQDRGSSGQFGYWPSHDARNEWAAEIGVLAQHPNVVVCESTDDARIAPDVLVAVSRKWSWHICPRFASHGLDRHFDLGVFDEAYQMQTSELLRVGARIDRLLTIGDPGQLEPFTTVETERWTGLGASPITPAPRSVEARFGTPEGARITLPSSLRLDHRAARVVQQCFYPDLPFSAVAVEGDRELRLNPAPRARDRLTRARNLVLDRAATSGWGLHELPAASTVRDDPELANEIAQLVAQLFTRDPNVRAHFPRPLRRGASLKPCNVAVATAHRDQRSRVREALDRLGPAFGEVVVDTANRIQGREFDVVFAWHPLSGRVDATAFHLDTGRLCVMASRHRHACILVTRAGLPALLDDHLPSGLRPKGTTEDREHDGWIAHRRLLDLVGTSG